MRVDIPGKGPIRFEGEDLSDTAKYFDVVPGYDSFPPEICKWILDLRYAWARVRQSESTLILKACDLLEEAAYANQKELLEKFGKGFPQFGSKELLGDWLESVLKIRKIAEAREVCRWTIQPVDGETEIFIKPCLSLVRTSQAVHKKRAFSDEFLANIESAPADEQLRFINLVVDAYSD